MIIWLVWVFRIVFLFTHFFLFTSFYVYATPAFLTKFWANFKFCNRMPCSVHFVDILSKNETFDQIQWFPSKQLDLTSLILQNKMKFRFIDSQFSFPTLLWSAGKSAIIWLWLLCLCSFGFWFCGSCCWVWPKGKLWTFSLYIVDIWVRHSGRVAMGISLSSLRTNKCDHTISTL